MERREQIMSRETSCPRASSSFRLSFRRFLLFFLSASSSRDDNAPPFVVLRIGRPEDDDYL
jgi:hypothetical protein